MYWFILRIFLLLAISRMVFSTKETEIDFLVDYLNFEPYPKVLTTFVCWRTNDKIKLAKRLFDENFRVSILDTTSFEYEEVDLNQIYPDQDISKYKFLDEIINTIKNPKKNERKGKSLSKKILPDLTNFYGYSGRKKRNSTPSDRSMTTLSLGSNTKTFSYNFSQNFRDLTLETKPKRNILKEIPQFWPIEYNFYILDFDCKSSEDILKISNRFKKFSFPYKWLILTENFTNFQNLIENLYAFPDSDVVIAEKLSDSEYILRDVYKVDKYGPGIVKEINRWTRKGFENYSFRVLSKERKNLMGKNITIVNYLSTNESYFHLYDYRYPVIDTISKMNFIVQNLGADYVNGTKYFYFSDNWGYQNPKTGKYSGVLAEIQNGNAELGGVFFVMKERFGILEYLTLFVPTAGKFIFKKPPLSYVTNIFTHPFSRMVWISSFFLVIVISIVFYFIIHVEWVYDEEKQSQGLQDSFLEVVMLTVGAMCIQGAPREPKSDGGRTAMFVGIVALMFLYVAYSANIITLLQSSAETINTLEDLLDSRIKLGTDDTLYNRYYFSIETEPIRKAIYDKKLAPPGEKPRFENINYGMQKIRDGFYAFHAEQGVAYKWISDTLYEEEKCGLHEIQYLSVSNPWYTMKKNSSYKEIFRVGLRKIGDYGIMSKELSKLYSKKPECYARGSNFSSVGIIDVYGAFLLLAAGGILSLIILIFELIFHYKFHMKCTKIL